MNTPKFPQNCVYQHGRLSMRLADGTAICSCNFWPQVLSASTENAEDTGNPVVRFRLCIDQQPCEPERELHLADFKKLDLEALDIRCQSEGDTRRLPQLIYQIARSQLGVEDVPTVPVFSEIGWTALNGAHVYVAGNRVIGPMGWVSTSDYRLTEPLHALTLEVNENISLAKASQYVRKLCCISPGVSDMLVATMIAGHLFSPFSDAGVTPRLVAYLVGPSMAKKTTLARLIGIDYNRSTDGNAQFINLLSTTAAVHSRASALSDCCCIVDDLNPSESKGEMRRREERLSEIIRTVGNAAPKEKCAGNSTVPQFPRGAAIVTAEYSLTAYSTMARCVLLRLDHPVPNEPLTVLQQSPRALSTFLFYIVRWCCNNYKEIVKFIQGRQAAHRAVQHQMTGMERLADAYFVLATAVDILAAFMQSVDPKHKKAIDGMVTQFHRSLSAVQNRQVCELSKLRRAVDQNRFSTLIAELYVSGRLDLCKKKKIRSGISGAKDRHHIYLSLHYLAQVVRKEFDDANITERAITEELRKNGLLEMDKSGRSTKKIHGVRLLHIPIDRLQRYLYSGSAAQPDTEDLYHLLHGGLRNNRP